MSHFVQALIFPQALASAFYRKLHRAQIVWLSDGLAMLPVTKAVLGELGGFVPDSKADSFLRLSSNVAALARELSEAGPIAYVETEYFGGIGTQSGVAWRDGVEVLSSTSDSAGPINAALGVLGVTADGFADPFAAVGLGRFRSNERWLEKGRILGQ